MGSELHVPTPIYGEGGSESEELELEGGLGWGTMFRKSVKILHLIGNLG
jgi:hypothetical protein